MTIIKAPAKKPEKSLENFIQSAPDGTSKTTIADKDVQITLRLSKEQLVRLTAVAKRQGIPRASYMKRAVFIQLEADEREQN